MSKKTNMKVQSATGKLRPHDMSSHLITTSNFGVMKPIKLISCVPGDKISLSVEEFTRLLPMPAPTYGSIISKTRAFFVPCRLLMPDWLEFISNNKKVTRQGVINPISTPMVSYRALYTAITNNTSLSTVVTTGAYDFVSPSPDRNNHYKLTSLGRRLIDFFFSIRCPLPLSLDKTANPYPFSLDEKISFLPFLAFVKFYIDWVVPSRFVYLYESFLRLFSFSTTSDLTSWLNSSDGSYRNLQSILVGFYSYYDDDFFTSCWQNALGTEVQQASSTEVNQGIVPPQGWSWTDEADGGNIVHGTYPPVIGAEDAPPYMTESSDEEYSNSGAQLTQPRGEIQYQDSLGSTHSVQQTPPLNWFSIKTLGALQDMISRGKLAGTKVQEYLRVTYGFEPGVDAMNLSTYLGVKQSEIMIGDVMSTAGTSVNELGQYAGRGIGSSSSKFTYECQEHGYFFVTNELCVKASYTDGLDFNWDQKDRFDFYMPQFDNLGCDAIPIKRLTNMPQPLNSDVNRNSIFGFSPRYSQMKFAFDAVSGDFRIPSLNSGLDSWYLNRTFDRSNSLLWTFINDTFCKATSDVSLNNLDRIFNLTTNEADHFYSIFRIGCRMMRPMLPFSEALSTYHHNELGKDMTTSINGGLQS